MTGQKDTFHRNGVPSDAAARLRMEVTQRRESLYKKKRRWFRSFTQDAFVSEEGHTVDRKEVQYMHQAYYAQYHISAPVVKMLDSLVELGRYEMDFADVVRKTIRDNRELSMDATWEYPHGGTD